METFLNTPQGGSLARCVASNTRSSINTTLKFPAQRVVRQLPSQLRRALLARSQSRPSDSISDASRVARTAVGSRRNLLTALPIIIISSTVEPGGKPSLFANAYATVGRWLVDHPAPLWLVNNPAKRWVAEQSAGDYDPVAVSSKLAGFLAADDVVVFSSTYCPFSLAAKRALAAEGVLFKVYETNKMQDGGPIVAELGKLTGRTSIPHIFIGGESVGGCNDGNPGIRPLIASGGLPAALEKAAARRDSATR